MWSADPVVWRKLARLGVAPIKTTTFEGKESGRFYRIPLATFRWGLKRKGHPGPGFARRPTPA